MDIGGNAVAGTTITFSITTGDGSFSGVPTTTEISNSSGTVQTFFTHGLTSGTALIKAEFDGMQGEAPIFSMLGLAPQPSTPTAIVGTVINTDVKPIGGMRVFLASNPSIEDFTDVSGTFRLEPVPTGLQRFVIDSSNTGPIDGVTYSDLAFELNVIQGQDNTIQMPAIVPPLDLESIIDVSNVQGGTLTLRPNPLWRLVVNPGQATFPGGSKSGRIHVTNVPAEKIPMPPTEGKHSRFFVAIKPAAISFSPPADVIFPNADNLPAGAITDIFSFDHDFGRFVKIGRGKVDEDEQTISSLPGEGLIHGGWHYNPPIQPGPTTRGKGKAPGCFSEFTTCGLTTQIDPVTGEFVLPGIPTSCDPVGLPGGLTGSRLPLGSFGGPGLGGIFRCLIKRSKERKRQKEIDAQYDADIRACRALPSARLRSLCYQRAMKNKIRAEQGLPPLQN